MDRSPPTYHPKCYEGERKAISGKSANTENG
ncbi:hypothetical protein OESDEN_18855 [Oesophagostomum dentatum]|uniref:Uncharacterized protein n=1 Tax=Oesophagostomum dentatum TaxID=61180 RepID=A0A0B1S945_OESDE|nr:hypothetical protein OESDEN_18855 [Oesophagostomum dentatum]